jgi:hypothetical protein
MRTFLILTGLALVFACGACRREPVVSPASSLPTPCNDPLRAQRLAEAFGHLKNARLEIVGKRLEPMDGHVEWSLWAGEMKTRRECTNALIFLEQEFAESSRARSSAAFPHLKNARMMLVGYRIEPVRNHLEWAKKVSIEELKKGAQKEIADIRNMLGQMNSQ